MAKKSDYNAEEIGNWNNAKRYSDVKIMTLLETLDKYENISEFGFPTYEESLKNANMNKLKLNYLKLCGFKFLVSGLIQLYRNSKFAISNDKKTAESCFKKLIIIQKRVMPVIGRITSNNTATLSKNYIDFLEVVKGIKATINFPLNKNSLIYMNKVEVDIEQQIKEDEEDFINKG